MKVSVITPTWQRHKLLLERCIPSVDRQTWPASMDLDVEHVICSDGRDAELRAKLAGWDVTYVEVPYHNEHPMNFGSLARNHALRHATGGYIAYLDDDNAWRPEHLELLSKALDDNPGAGFAYSAMLTHPQGTVIGGEPPRYGGIDTSMILHRAELLEIARWPRPRDIVGDQHAPDWAIVAAWLAAGVDWVHVPVITVDYHFAGS